MDSAVTPLEAAKEMRDIANYIAAITSAIVHDLESDHRSALMHGAVSDCTTILTKMHDLQGIAWSLRNELERG